MAIERLPVTQHIQRLCNYIFEPDLLEDYKNHTKPLNIQAQGDVLIIGAGPRVEELSLIEPEIACGSIDSLTLIGTHPVLSRHVINTCQKEYPIPVETTALSYGHIFEDGHPPTFDTMMFIGTPLQHPDDTINYLALNLRSSGHLYVTVNGSPPTTPFEVENCSLDIIPDIPPNPNYSWIPDYYGLVVKKK